jgi:hypothetical protein
MKYPFRKIHPILFSEVMVNALLRGRKTQTRRTLPPWQIPTSTDQHDWMAVAQRHRQWGFCVSGKTEKECAEEILKFGVCRYGKRGDLLWVRETHYRFGHWETIPGVTTKTGRIKWRFVPDTDELLYDAPASYRKGRHHKDSATPAWHARLARFMPRSASRITLELTKVRIEQLQDITTGDAWDEGCPNSDVGAIRYWFKPLWESINGTGSWSDNPWVWVLNFIVHKRNVDEFSRAPA